MLTKATNDSYQREATSQHGNKGNSRVYDVSHLDAVIYDNESNKNETQTHANLKSKQGRFFAKGGEDDDCEWLYDNRVGNNRLRCMIENHSQSFASAILCNDKRAMDQVAETIVDTFCNKCKLSSRLLEQRTEENEKDEKRRIYYVDLGDGPEAKARVVQGLRVTASKLHLSGEQDEQSGKRISSVVAAAIHPSIRSAGESAMEANAARRQSLLLANQKKRRLNSSIAKNNGSNDHLNQDASLLLEAAGAFKNAPLATKTTPKTSSTDNAGQGTSMGGVTFVDDADLNKFDVVITGPLGDAIEQSDRYAGNNRIRVIASSRREAFAAADAPAKRQMAIELFDQLKNDFNPPGSIVVHRDHPAANSTDETTVLPIGCGCGKWKEVDRETSIIILEKTLTAACKGLAEEKLKAPIEAIANADISAVRSAAIASLEERQLRKELKKERSRP